VIVVLVIAAIAGWIAFDGRGDTIKEYQGQIKDMEREIDNLRDELHCVSDERDQLYYELRTIYHKPLDLSGVTPIRSHSLADISRDSQFWNVMPGEGKLEQRDIQESYDKTLTPEVMFMGAVLYEWDILEDITSAWESLDAKGITSVIMVGKRGLANPTFSECDQIWLLVLWTKQAMRYRGWAIMVDPVTGDKFTAYTMPYPFTVYPVLDHKSFVLTKDINTYFGGYIYTSPADLRADIEGR
jgi:hypothetical protein